MSATIEVTPGFLVGSWELAAYRISGGAGPDVTYAPSVRTGRLTYAADQGFSVVIEATPGQPPYRLAYAGRWELADGAMLHHVASANRAGWAGTTMVRDITAVDGVLRLSTRVDGQLHAADWIRVGAPHAG